MKMRFDLGVGERFHWFRVNDLELVDQSRIEPEPGIGTTRATSPSGEESPDRAIYATAFFASKTTSLGACLPLGLGAYSPPLNIATSEGRQTCDPAGHRR